MNEKLKALRDLQKLDSQLWILDRNVKKAPERIAEIEKERSEARSEFDGSVKDMEGKRRRLKELELDIKSAGDRMKIAEGRLMQIKNNAEYQAMLKEIAQMKAAVDSRETEYLTLGEEVEKLKEPLRLKNLEWDEIERQHSARCDDLRGKVAVDQAELHRRKDERLPFLARLTAREIKQYEDLRSIRNGLAVCGSYAYICLGCNMSVPPHLYNQIISGQDILQCNHCKRFLFFDPPPEATSGDDANP